MTSTTTLTTPSDTQIVSERTFAASRDRVYATYTDPALIPQWWGPRRMTTVVDQMDFRPGGTWRFVSGDPGAGEHAFHGTYKEITPPERIVQTFEYEGTPGHVVLETVTFEDLGGSTRVRVVSVFNTREERDGMIDAGMERGLTESHDRLEELLAATA